MYYTLKMLKQCIYCNHTKLYKLGNGHLKCASCNRKISPAKIEKIEKLILSFCKNLTAREAANECKCSYMTAKKYYDNIRLLITQYLETEYNLNADKVKEFDEYFYLERSKKKDVDSIFEIENFLTFDYGGKIYNILMPSLKKYRTPLSKDKMQHEYYKQLSRFIKFRRVAKLEHLDNTITKFWNFFEESIKRYRGVDRENFIYYLKEAEFKFNYTKEEQINILSDLMLHLLKQ